MKLYELTDLVTLQGDIMLKVFDQNGEDIDHDYYNSADHFTAYHNDGIFENAEVLYIYPENRGGDAVRLVIEVQVETEN